MSARMGISERAKSVVSDATGRLQRIEQGALNLVGTLQHRVVGLVGQAKDDGAPTASDEGTRATSWRNTFHLPAGDIMTRLHAGSAAVTEELTTLRDRVTDKSKEGVVFLRKQFSDLKTRLGEVRGRSSGRTDAGTETDAE